MRTILFILIGLILAGLCLGLTPSPWRGRAAMAFVIVWLVVSGVNLSIGLSKGYLLTEELLVHLFLFGIPAGAALFGWWLSRTP